MNAPKEKAMNIACSADRGQAANRVLDDLDFPVLDRQAVEQD